MSASQLTAILSRHRGFTPIELEPIRERKHRRNVSARPPQRKDHLSRRGTLLSAELLDYSERDPLDAIAARNCNRLAASRYRGRSEGRVNYQPLTRNRGNIAANELLFQGTSSSLLPRSARDCDPCPPRRPMSSSAVWQRPISSSYSSAFPLR